VGAVDITGDLDVDNININGNTISSTDTNGNITLAPNGTGVVALSSTDLTFGDNDKAIFGAGSDLQIYHNGSASDIKETGTGNLRIWGDDIQFFNSAGSKYHAQMITDGAVTLYYNGAEKLSTTATGIDVTGTAVTDGLTVAGNVSVDSGTIKLDGNYPTGTGNVALGDAALDDGSLSGGNNTAIGSGALTANTSGAGNVAIGTSSGFANTTGISNTSVGFQSLASNTTASNSTAVGYQAMYANTTGLGNAAFGYIAMKDNTTGIRNTAVGSDAFKTSTTGSSNTALGYASLLSNTTGGSNTALGDNALYSNTTASYNTAVGAGALKLNTTGVQNTSLGFESLRENTTGTDNTAVGLYAGLSNTTGNYNISVGTSALLSNTTASNNTAVGYTAGYSNTTGAGNVFMGFACGYNTTTGGLNVAIGHDALKENQTSSRNTAIGYNALYSVNPGAVDAENVSIGLNSGFYLTTGTQNTFLGTYAGNYATTGTYNTFIGRSSGNAITTGSKNTILGSYSGNQGGLDIRTASNNIVLSDGDGNPRVYVDSSGFVGVNDVSPNNRLTVYDSAAESAGGAHSLFARSRNAIRFGNTGSLGYSGSGYPAMGYNIGFTATSNVYQYYGSDSVWMFDFGNLNRLTVRSSGAGTGGTTVSLTAGPYVALNGTSWTSSSDERLKENLEDLSTTTAYEFCKTARAVKFDYKDDNDYGNSRYIGFIAQDWQENYSEIVDVASSGTENVLEGELGLSYDKTTPILMAALKEAIAKIETLEAKVAALESN